MKSNYPNQITALWTAFLLALLFHTDRVVSNCIDDDFSCDRYFAKSCFLSLDEALSQVK